MIAEDGVDIPIPIDAAAINITGVAQDYMRLHPDSDLGDLLSGRKTFVSAIHDLPKPSTEH